MEYDLQFQILGAFNKRIQQLSIEFIPNLDRISIIHSAKQKLFDLHFSDENVQFQWIQQEENLEHLNYVLLSIKKEEYKIFGKQNNLEWLFNLCKGKFLFLQKGQNTQRHFVEQNETGIIYKLNDKCHNDNEYFIKVLDRQQQLNKCMNIPEELKVLKLVNQIKCPYLIKIETFQYDGQQFSYCFQTKKLETLRQFIYENPNLQLSQVLEIIRQLLQVTQYFESIKLVFNRFDLDNIQYSKNENIIQITNFSHSFVEQGIPMKLAQQIGHACPESFSQSQLMTTSSNIYQIGILFYIMVFGNNPFGQSQDEIQKNNENGNFLKPKLNGSKSQNLIRVHQKIFEIISSMMSRSPEQRKFSQDYMTSKIFLPFLKQKISRMEFKLQFNQNQDDDVINEENKNLNSIYILQTKFKQY